MLSEAGVAEVTTEGPDKRPMEGSQVASKLERWSEKLCKAFLNKYSSEK